jgi:predicted DNA-binding transcriptional regulator YafY
MTNVFSMATKRNISGIPKLHNERLVILDEILSKSTSAITKENLFLKLNSRLSEKISQSSFDKDIRDLKQLLEEYAIKNNYKISLINKRDSGYYYSITGFKLFGHSLSNDERNLLLYANSLFEVFSGTELVNEFKNVTQRLLDNSVLSNQEDLFPSKIVQVEQYSGTKAKSWIPVLLDAIIKNNCLEVKYTNAQLKTSNLNLSPYVIKQFDQKWYVIAFDSTKGKDPKTKVYALDSIHSIAYTNKPYIKDEQFNADQYFEYSIGVWHFYNQDPVEVILEFNDPKLFQDILNNPIHHSQKCITQNEKHLIVGIKVYESIELLYKIRKYGAAVKILSPTSLAENIKNTAREVIELYE